MTRMFVALWPLPAAARRLGEQAREAASRHGGRAMPAADLHVTLAFIGELAPAAAIGLAARLRSGLHGACPPPDASMVFDRIGSFRGANVTWLGPSVPPAWLQPLAMAVRDGLDGAGVAYDRKPFVPHLTIVRGARAPADGIAPLSSSGWRVALVRSAKPAESAGPGAGRYQIMEWLDEEAAPCNPAVTRMS